MPQTRTLVLLRHAKSAWPDNVADEQRPLNKRGLRDAPAAGRWLRVNLGRVRHVYVSPALRTRQTWQLAASSGGYPDKPDLEPRIYGAGRAGLLRLVHSLDSSVTTAVIVGHNPGLQDLALELATDKGRSRRPRRDLAGKFPTCAIAVLEWNGGWSDAKRGKAVLRHFVVPRG